MSLFSLAPSQYTDKEWLEEVEKIRDVIVTRARPTGIVIFGSGATGERTSESDLDLAVFYTTEEESKNAPARILAGAPFQTVPVDLLVFHREEFLLCVEKGGVALEIRKTGKCIFGVPPWKLDKENDAEK